MGSFQASIGMRCSTMMETSCGYLLQELRMIWNEVGEDQFEREKVLLDIEQECLEVYRRKVDAANTSRAHLHQELAEAEAQLTHLLLSLGERALPGRPEKMAGTLKEQLDSITPALREMKLRKDERVNQFRGVLGQIQKIFSEIAGESEYSNSSSNVIVNENDLSLNKLEEYHMELQRLLNEKNERLQRLEKHIDKIQDMAAILGMDSSMIITKIHPSLNELCGISKNISDNILHKLTGTVKSLEEEKQKRLEKLHHLGKSLINLWNLMDTRYEDRRLFSHVTGLLSISAVEVSNPGSLAQNIILQAEAEVNRLDQLKAIKTKELFLKKRNELEEICNKSHMEIPSRAEMDNITKLINSRATGEIDHANLLASMDEQISRAKEEALSRKAIMEKMEKWIVARDEKRWLEEYNRDENRYAVSRGAHRNLRRAERARITVNKIPDLMEILIAKTKSWEEERKKVFLYDEVPLLAMLEEYNALIKEKEGEKKQRQKEKKKVQSQVAVKQENTFGSRPSTSNRRLSNRSLNGSLMNSPSFHRSNSASQHTSIIKEEKKAQVHKIKTYFRPGLFSQLRDETASVLSTFSP